MDTKNYITVERAMDILHLSKSTVYSYVKEGKIPAYRISNGKILFKEEELLSLLENSKVIPLDKPKPIKLPVDSQVKIKPATKEEVLNRLKTL